MNFRSRSLLGVNSSTTTTTTSTTVTDQSDTENSDSDFVVILAALLCALICVLGLVAVARCAWIRRLSGRVIGRPDPSPPAANKGLKKKILKSLPKLTYSAEDESTAKFTECAICLSEFVAGDELRVLPQCGHGFHVGCIDTWLGSHSSCPSCRQILAVTSRCKKCGELPENSVAGGTVTGPRPTEIPVNPFLP